MSLRPIRSKRAGKRGYYRALRSRQQWKPWKGWTPAKAKNKALELFGRKKFVLGIIVLAVILGGIGLYADPHNPLFHSYNSNDPITFLYRESFASSNLSGFNCNRATYFQQASTKGIKLASDNNGPAICMAKSGVDLSLANGKQLVVLFGTNLTSTNNEADFFLTRNSTLVAIGPDSNYNPADDRNVAMLIKIFWQSGTNCGSSNCNFRVQLFMQREPVALSQGQYFDCSGGNGEGVCYADESVHSSSLDAGFPETYFTINYTGGVGASANSGLTTLTWGSSFAPTYQTFPWLNLAGGNYYVGYYVPKGTITATFVASFPAFGKPNPCADAVTLCMSLAASTTGGVSTVTPNIDTGGFFGPVIKALLNLGVFILNGILAFISFVTPALQSALGVLESVMATILNFLGGLLGYPTLGTDLLSFITGLFQFFFNVTYGLPAAFANFPTLFTDFLKWLQIVFPVITPAFTIASGILNVAVNGISQAITIFTIALQLVLFGYAFILIFAYFMFTGDDAVGGLLTFLGTAQAIAFRIINLIAVFVNYGLDILTNVIGLIPKPLVQMAAAKFPRLPTLDSAASITIPAMDRSEEHTSELLSVWLWTVGFYFDVWYESRNPALPGSLSSLVPSVATNMQTLSSLLPLLQTFVLVSGGTVLFWIVMRPLHVLGADLGVFESIGIGAGSRGGAGPSSFGISAGKKHFQGRLERVTAKGKVGGSPEIDRSRTPEEQATS